MDRIEGPEINPCMYAQFTYDRGPKVYSGEKTVSSINCVRKTGLPHAKELNWTTVLYHTQTLNQNGIKDLNVRLKTIDLLGENIGGTLLDISYGNAFLDLIPKATAKKAKINKWEDIKLKSCTAEETINKIKGSLLNVRKYCKSCIC